MRCSWAIEWSIDGIDGSRCGPSSSGAAVASSSGGGSGGGGISADGLVAGRGVIGSTARRHRMAGGLDVRRRVARPASASTVPLTARRGGRGAGRRTAAGGRPSCGSAAGRAGPPQVRGAAPASMRDARRASTTSHRRRRRQPRRRPARISCRRPGRWRPDRTPAVGSPCTSAGVPATRVELLPRGLRRDPRAAHPAAQPTAPPQTPRSRGRPGFPSPPRHRRPWPTSPRPRGAPQVGAHMAQQEQRRDRHRPHHQHVGERVGAAQLGGKRGGHQPFHRQADHADEHDVDRHLHAVAEELPQHVGRAALRGSGDRAEP